MKRLYLLIISIIFCYSVNAQNEEVKRTTIINSLGLFFDNLSNINDELDPIPANVFVSTFGNKNIISGGGNYFRYNSRDMDMASFIDWYAQKCVEGKNINHSLNITQRQTNVKPLGNSSDDQRWEVKCVMQRTNANFEEGNATEDYLIKNVPVNFVVRYNGEGKEVSILEINISNPVIQKVYPVFTNDTTFVVDKSNSRLNLLSDGGDWSLKMNSYCTRTKSYPGFDKKESSKWSIDYAFLPNAGDAKLLSTNVSNGIIQGKVPKNYSQNSRSYKVYVQQTNSNKSYYVSIDQSAAVKPCPLCDFFEIDNYHPLNQIEISYSLKYGIGLSYKYHFEDTRFYIGGKIATNFDTFRGVNWFAGVNASSKVTINVDQHIGDEDLYKINKEDVKPETNNYSSLMDPYNAAKKYTARSLFLVQGGVHVTNWLNFNLGAGIALNRNLYYLDTAYGYRKYSYEKLDPSLPDIDDVYQYSAYYKNYYYKDSYKVHFALRPAVDFRIPLGSHEYINIGAGYVITPGFKDGSSVDFSLGYTFDF